MKKNLLVALLCLASLSFLASCGKKCNECDTCDRECVQHEEIVKH